MMTLKPSSFHIGLILFCFLILEGTIWTATAHVITGVIGAGVLSLAWSIAQLGWIAGPLCMIFFAAITIVSTYLLCDCYRFPDPEHGPIRNRSYMEAVKFYLGE
jgi:amino acid permease